MRVHLHTLCWNDRRMMDFFFRHCSPWVDRFYLFDDRSDDGTRAYLESRDDVVVADLERAHPDSWVLSAQHIYDTSWRRSCAEADWVVVTNIDEHLFCPPSPERGRGGSSRISPARWLRALGRRFGRGINADDQRAHGERMRRYLQQALDAGITAIPALGYQMLLPEWPRPDSILWRDYTAGAPWVQMSKMGIFRPDRIAETRFTPGRHQADFQGDLVLRSTDRIMNLHYKYLGLDDTHARHLALAQRLGPLDRAKG